MPDVLGIDHIYLAVSDLARSEAFYDQVLGALGFRKTPFTMGGEAHFHYFNRHFGVVLRPARSRRSHNPYTPGRHHLCFRVEAERQVRELADLLSQVGIAVSPPRRLYHEYAPDCFACFLEDPDGMRLEVTNYRAERRERHDHWNERPA